MDDLTAWLRECLDDDERVALACGKRWEGPAVPQAVAAGFGAGSAIVAHIARWDPARVLALVSDIRRMIHMFEQRAEEGQQPGGEVFGYHATGMLTAIRCVAEGLYADREGYQESWRP